MTPIALVCTRGFADVLTLERQNRPDPYAPHVGPSPWLERLPPALRLEVPGRIDAHGAEAEPLTPEALAALAAQVAALRSGPAPIGAVAVCLLFARRNPAHEAAVQAALATACPGLPVVCSHTLDAVTAAGTASLAHGGEFERSVATVEAAWAVLGATPAPAAPATPATTSAVDAEAPGELADALEHLANAMQATLVERAVSSVVREAMDCAVAVFLPDGRLLAQARTLPLLLGSLAPAVAGLLEVFPAAAQRDGDGYLSNDPWAGGTHLPDLVLMRPVLVGGRVRALAACILHHQDVGGMTPGSVPTDATSIQQEGLRLPPLQLYRNASPEPGIWRLLKANSRMPDNLAGDLGAQWLALSEGAAALQALVAARGEAFEVQAEALIAASAAEARAALRAAPDGSFAFRDALDGDGLDDTLVPIEVRLDKHGDALTIDLRHCAPQTRGPVNASRGAVWAAVSYFARMLAPQAASNHGSTAPITLLTTPGTVVDPAFPAAINARTNLVKLLANALLGAWAQARPAEAPAANAGVAVVLSLSGRTVAGHWLFTEIIASAAGGAPWQPGGSGASTDISNVRNTPVEVIEAQAPLRMETFAVRQGSGGAGRQPGGCGVVRAYRLLEGEGLISYRGERHRTRAAGAAGGQPGASGSARIERRDGTVEPLPAKARVRWQAGDRLVIETAGGGGWGEPAPHGSEIA